MFNPTQNLANQLANPYTYNPKQSPIQKGMVLSSPYVDPVQGWATAGQAFFQPEAPPAAVEEAPTTPPAAERTGGSAGATAGLITGGPAAAEIPRTVTTGVPAPERGYAPPAMGEKDFAQDPKNLLGQIELKENFQAGYKDNTQEYARLMGEDAKNYDVEGYLENAQKQGMNWGDIGKDVAVGGVLGGVPGAIAGTLKGLVGSVFQPSQPVKAEDAAKVRAELQKTINAAIEGPADDQSGFVEGGGAPAVDKSTGQKLSLPEPYSPEGGTQVGQALSDQYGIDISGYGLYGSDKPMSVDDWNSATGGKGIYKDYLSSVLGVSGTGNHDYSNPDYDAGAAGPFGSSMEGASDPGSDW